MSSNEGPDPVKVKTRITDMTGEGLKYWSFSEILGAAVAALAIVMIGVYGGQARFLFIWVGVIYAERCMLRADAMQARAKARLAEQFIDQALGHLMNEVAKGISVWGEERSGSIPPGGSGTPVH